VKAILVEEAGGVCAACGAAKQFALSAKGVARSLARARAEAAKCVLLCANCHAEVEAGVRTIAA
jgi:hypothetical protein